MCLYEDQKGISIFWGRNIHWLWPWWRELECCVFDEPLPVFLFSCYLQIILCCIQTVYFVRCCIYLLIYFNTTLIVVFRLTVTNLIYKKNFKALSHKVWKVNKECNIQLFFSSFSARSRSFFVFLEDKAFFLRAFFAGMPEAAVLSASTFLWAFLKVQCCLYLTLQAFLVLCF